MRYDQIDGRYMIECDEVRIALIDHLRRDAVAHREGRLDEIGKDFWELDHRELASGDPLSIAHRFWDGWIDARNHDWLYYPGIEERDWPRLAESLATILENGAEVNDPVLIEHFAKTANYRGRLYAVATAVMTGVVMFAGTLFWPFLWAGSRLRRWLSH